MKFTLLPVAVAMALSACSLTPTLIRPVAPIPSQYPVHGTAASTAGESRPVADIGWRSMFTDARLQRLIELALINNRDLRLAALNVDAVRAQYDIQRAAALPAVEAGGSFTRERAAAGVNGAATPSTQNQYGVNVRVTAFELDLFGRVRALSDAAMARYLASEQGRRAAQISLVGAVADAYVAERLAREQLKLAVQTVDDWRQSLALAQRLNAASQSSALDVAQSEAQVALAEADLEARRRVQAQAINALVMLVGTELPADLPEGSTLESHGVITRLPAGLPSELLTRRPDLQQAEQALIAANADIGAARAALFPSVSLTASIGSAGTGVSDLFKAGSGVWSFAPQITQPLFQAGRLRTEVRLAVIRKSASVAEYERAIQTAFREVADGLAGSESYARQLDAQRRSVTSAEQRASLSALRYRAGMDGRLELLDAQRQLHAARQALLDVRRAEIGNAIALYKALGGGL